VKDDRKVVREDKRFLSFRPCSGTTAYILMGYFRFQLTFVSSLGSLRHVQLSNCIARCHQISDSIFHTNCTNNCSVSFQVCIPNAVRNFNRGRVVINKRSSITDVYNPRRTSMILFT